MDLNQILKLIAIAESLSAEAAKAYARFKAEQGKTDDQLSDMADSTLDENEKRLLEIVKAHAEVK